MSSYNYYNNPFGYVKQEYAVQSQMYDQQPNTYQAAIQKPVVTDTQQSEKKKRKRKPKGEPKKARIANPSEWKKNKAKKGRLTGQEYVSSTGIVVPARTMGPDCKCSRECFTVERQPVYQKLFTEFYNMKSKDIQDMYLCGMIHSEKVKRRQSKIEGGILKAASYKYHIKAPNLFIQVCKKAFCSVFAVGESRLQRLQRSVTDWTVPEDKRGKHSNKTWKVQEETLTMIDQHVLSFIKDGKTIPPNLTLKGLLDSYNAVAEIQEKEDTKNGVKTKRKIGQDFLRGHLKTRFNISFAGVNTKVAKINSK